MDRRLWMNTIATIDSVVMPLSGRMMAAYREPCRVLGAHITRVARGDTESIICDQVLRSGRRLPTEKGCARRRRVARNNRYLVRGRRACQDPLHHAHRLNRGDRTSARGRSTTRLVPQCVGAISSVRHVLPFARSLCPVVVQCAPAPLGRQDAAAHAACCHSLGRWLRGGERVSVRPAGRERDVHDAQSGSLARMLLREVRSQ